MWLISEEFGLKLVELERSDRLSQPDAVAFREKVAAEEEASLLAAPRSYSAKGEVAVIRIEGMLTAQPNFIARLFGLQNTTYRDIVRSVAEAERDPNIGSVRYEINTPGGEAAGILDAVAAIQASEKPAIAVADKALSGGYWLLSAISGKSKNPGRLVAANEGSSFGSLGAVVEAFVSDSIVSITSSNAPNKRPDVRTEEGKAQVREQLDAIESLFIESVAQGRGVSIDIVKSTFGRGGVMLAESALQRNMIDDIETRVVRKATDSVAVTDKHKPQAVAKTGGALTQGNKMDVATLQSQHPAVYEAVRKEALAEGHKSGSEATLAKERDRIEGHLTLAQSSGEMKFACECILNGAELTATVQAKHMAAAMNRRDVKNREEDDKDVSSAGAGASGSSTEKDLGDQVVELFDATYGKAV